MHIVPPHGLAYVRLREGGVVQVNGGATVPADLVDDSHVALLVKQGVLVEAEQSPELPPPPPAGGKPRK